MKKMMKSRAWNLVRAALLWARKGGVFRTSRWHLMALHAPKFVKSLHFHSRRDPYVLDRYGERQFSFDDTPVIHVKMHRPASLRFKLPHIPCINPPHVDFDFDYDFDDDAYDNADYKSDRYEDEDSSFSSEEEGCCGRCDDDDQGEGIDVKAEEFIAKFYEQIKLQRQISYLQYNEVMVNRGDN